MAAKTKPKLNMTAPVYNAPNGQSYSKGDINKALQSQEYANWAKSNPTGNIYQYISGVTPGQNYGSNVSGGTGGMGGAGPGILPSNSNTAGTTAQPTSSGGATNSPATNTSTTTSTANTGGGIDLSNPYQYQMGPAQSMYENLFNQATQGTTNEFNNAANRLRERIDASTAGASDRAKGQALSRGFGSSGINDKAQYQVQAAGQNAYAQGLSDLEGQYGQLRQQGLNTALGATSGISNIWDNLNKSNLQDLTRLGGLYEGAQGRQVQREGIQSNERLGKMNNTTQEKQLNQNNIMQIVNMIQSILGGL